MSNAADINRKLIYLRGGKTRAEVAEALGIGVTTLTMYELGYRTPRDEIKVRIARYYGVTVGWLFYGEEA